MAQTVSTQITDADFEALIREAAAEQRVTGLANLPRCDRSRWCVCARTEAAESYYETPTGVHGWFHDPAQDGCGGITQTG